MSIFVWFMPFRLPGNKIASITAEFMHTAKNQYQDNTIEIP